MSFFSCRQVLPYVPLICYLYTHRAGERIKLLWSVSMRNSSYPCVSFSGCLADLLFYLTQYGHAPKSPILPAFTAIIHHPCTNKNVNQTNAIVQHLTVRKKMTRHEHPQEEGTIKNIWLSKELTVPSKKTSCLFPTASLYNLFVFFCFFVNSK